MELTGASRRARRRSLAHAAGVAANVERGTVHLSNHREPIAHTTFHTVNEAPEPPSFRNVEIAPTLPRTIRVRLTPGVSGEQRAKAPTTWMTPMKAR